MSGSPSAAEFLKLFAAKLPEQIQIRDRLQVADAFRSREEKYTTSMNNITGIPAALRMRSFGDVAAVKATDAAGHELRLRAWVQCRQGNQGGDCFARVDVLRTTKGQLAALMAAVDGANLVQEVPDAKWQTACLARQQHVGGQQMETLRKAAQAGSDMLRQQYLDSSARLQREHEAGTVERSDLRFNGQRYRS